MNTGLTKAQEVLAGRFLETLTKNPNGMRQSEFKQIGVGSAEDDEVNRKNLQDMVAVINYLTKIHRIKSWMRRDGNHDPLFRIIDEEKWNKISGLTDAEVQIYEIIEESGATGIWIRDIKNAVGYSTGQVQKHLGALEKKALVKKVNPVSSKSRKHYILTEFEPSAQITGGPWYTAGEFDDDFIFGIKNLVKRYIERAENAEGFLSSEEILEKLTQDGIIAKETMDKEHMDIVLSTMVYGEEIEEVGSGEAGSLKAVPRFKIASPFFAPNHLAQTPCGICPVSDQCYEGGVISPTSCPYMQDWFEWNYLEDRHPLQTPGEGEMTM
jgi:DNA-directed RNA polymerase III subunit RPC6